MIETFEVYKMILKQRKNRYFLLSSILLFSLLLFTFSVCANSHDTDTAQIEYAKKAVDQKAKDVAKQVEIFIRANPDKSIKELQEDEYFRSIAVQIVGKTGYTCIFEAGSGIMRMHPNQQLIDKDISYLNETLPQWWRIYDEGKKGINISGSYEWIEKDGSKKEKYMAIIPVGKKLGNTTLMVAATTYYDEYEIEPDTLPDPGNDEYAQFFDESELKFAIDMPLLIINIGGIIIYLFFILSIGENKNLQLKRNFIFLIVVSTLIGLLDIIRLNSVSLELSFWTYRLFFSAHFLLAQSFLFVILDVAEIQTKRYVYYVRVIGSIILASLFTFTNIIVKGSYYSDVVHADFGPLSYYLWGLIGLLVFSALLILIIKARSSVKSRIFLIPTAIYFFTLISLLLTDRLHSRYDLIQISAPIIIVASLGLMLFRTGFLKQKTNTVMILLGITLLLIIGIVILNTYQITASMQREAYKSTQSYLETIAFSQAGNIDIFLDSKKQLLTDFSRDMYIKNELKNISSENIHGTPKGLNIYLADTKKKLSRDIYEIYVMDMYGRLIATTDERRSFEEYLSSDPVFTNGANDVFISDVIFDVILQQNVFVVSAPIKDGNSLIGVIAIKFSISPLEDIASVMGKTSSSGRSYIVNLDKLMITNPGPGKNMILEQQVYTENSIECFEDLRQYPDEAVDEDIFEKRRGEDFKSFVDYRGVLVLGTDRPIPGVNWCLLVETDEAEITSSISSSIRKVWQFTIGMIISLLAIGMVFNYFLTKSLRKDIDHKTQELKNFNIQLEELVKERTKEVKQKSTELEKLNTDLEKEVRKKTKELEVKLGKEERTSKAMIYFLKRMKQTNADLQLHKRELQKSNRQLIMAEEKLSMFNKELEKQVGQRTKELETAYQKLKKLDELKDNFLSNVSHELRTPLTSIRSYNQLIYDGILGGINPKQKESIKIILDSTDQLVGLIDDLLDVSRFEADKQQMHFEDSNLKDAINEVISEFKPILTKIGGEIRFKGLSSATANIDVVKIKQAVRNIVNNAIKYRSVNKLIINISLEKQKGSFVVSIKDNGIGISKENTDHLFDKFYQVDQSMTRRVGGAGLGLSIVKHIINAHNGKIKVESRVGKGSVFRIYIPSENSSIKK